MDTQCVCEVPARIAPVDSNSQLPNEILVKVLSYLSPQQIFQVERVSKTFQKCTFKFWEQFPSLVLNFKCGKASAVLRNAQNKAFTSKKDCDTVAVKGIFKRCAKLQRLTIHSDLVTSELLSATSTGLSENKTPVTNLFLGPVIVLDPSVPALIRSCNETLESIHLNSHFTNSYIDSFNEFYYKMTFEEPEMALPRILNELRTCPNLHAFSISRAIYKYEFSSYTQEEMDWWDDESPLIPRLRSSLYKKPSAESTFTKDHKLSEILNELQSHKKLETLFLEDFILDQDFADLAKFLAMRNADLKFGMWSMPSHLHHPSPYCWKPLFQECARQQIDAITCITELFPMKLGHLHSWKHFEEETLFNMLPRLKKISPIFEVDC